jgi:hypothetical protein
MAKFAIGDAVNRGKSNTGKVVAVYTTTDGELRYAVENEGALEFVLEAELSLCQAEHQAA